MDLRKAYNRVSFGIKPNHYSELESLGWKSWVQSQLKPGEENDIKKYVNEFAYTLEVGRGKNKSKKRFSIDTYALSNEELWIRYKGISKEDRWKKDIPAADTAIMTFIRATRSKWQLQEVMAEFWHNHFNVSIEADDHISPMFPVYDRDVIRPNIFGNFRTFLEATAKSPCMLFYLDNAFSSASPANENYARELFELHTLGAMHYLNDLYDDWRKVPGAWEGMAEGYIDEDVYEAARAFTGWTVGMGRKFNRVELPDTGDFVYYDQWHDHYQKRVMGAEFRSHRGEMYDGLKVLDILAYHPGTAKHLSTKLVTWLVNDNPPESLISKAAEVWMKHQKDDDQIARVIETILLSDEFEASLDQDLAKVKRPNHLVYSIVRQLDLSIDPQPLWAHGFKQMGYHQFSWPLPTGHPDTKSYWLNTDMMLKRWNVTPLLLWLQMDATGEHLLRKHMDVANMELDTLIDFWSERLLGHTLNEEVKAEIRSAMAHKEMKDFGDPNSDYRLIQEHAGDQAFEYVLLKLVSLLALSPEFQKR